MFVQRWSQPNGYRQVLSISLPLVASMGSITLMQFTDRMFLANYSIEAISAAVPAGIASFTFIALLMGVASYTNVFVAQYTGAGAYQRVGAALWQGIYFALFSAVILASLYFISDPIFRIIGHSPSVQILEVQYFRILTLGAGLVIMGSAMATFFTGRGLTWTVMIVHFTGGDGQHSFGLRLDQWNRALAGTGHHRRRYRHGHGLCNDRDLPGGAGFSERKPASFWNLGRPFL